jgi:hypothetical protein
MTMTASGATSSSCGISARQMSTLMPKVQHLGVHLGLGLVVEDDVVGGATDQTGVGEGGADGAGPHDGDLVRRSEISEG